MVPNTRRTLTRTLTLIAVVGMAATIWASASASASAAAAAPTGALTRAEYKRLSVGMAALNRSAGVRSVNWAKTRSACRAVGRATVLLRTQRASCLDSMSVLDALASFPAEQRRCRAAIRTTGTTTGTTTAGTATTPTGPAVIRLVICMRPRYDALARYARRLDTGAILSRRAAVARGFGGPCLAALAPTRLDLKHARRFASSTERLAADVRLLIKVTEGKEPSNDFDQAKIDSDVKRFETAANAVLHEHGQPKLSVCPHAG